MHELIMIAFETTVNIKKVLLVSRSKEIIKHSCDFLTCYFLTWICGLLEKIVGVSACKSIYKKESNGIKFGVVSPQEGQILINPT